MNRYPDKVLSLTEILKRSIRLHYLTLKHTIACILLIAIVKNVAVMGLSLFTSAIMQWIIYLVAAVLIVYFFAVALQATNSAFRDQPKSIMDSMKSAWNNIIQTYLAFFAYVFGAIIVFRITRLLIVAVDKLIHEPSAMHGLVHIIALTLTLLFVAIFYFGFPITIVDEKSMHKSFYDSILLSEKEKLGILMSLLILGAVILLLTPSLVSEYFLSMFHLDALFDFVVLCVALPLFVNSLLLLLSDAKKQMALEE